MALSFSHPAFFSPSIFMQIVPPNIRANSSHVPLDLYLKWGWVENIFCSCRRCSLWKKCCCFFFLKLVVSPGLLCLVCLVVWHSGCSADTPPWWTEVLDLRHGPVKLSKRLRLSSVLVIFIPRCVCHWSVILMRIFSSANTVGLEQGPGAAQQEVPPSPQNTGDYRTIRVNTNSWAASQRWSQSLWHLSSSTAGNTFSVNMFLL